MRFYVRKAFEKVAPHWLILLGGLGLCARVVIAVATLGSNDMLTWKEFADQVERHGLGHVYDKNEHFNHPPLMGLLAGKLYALAGWTGLRFEVLFKLPLIAGDAAAAFILYRVWKHKDARYAGLAFAVFCWNPVSLLITSYHGNTDSLCAGLSLLAAVLVDRRLPFWGGLALGASINVKLIPVLLIVVLFSCVRSRQQAGRLLLGLSLGALPFVPIAVWHWDGFYAHVLGWRSYSGEWGITGLFKEIGASAHFSKVIERLNGFWVERGAVFVLAFPAVLAAINLWRERRWSARELGACAYAGFVVLAPGWGIQYLVYPVPLLFAANLGRATAYTLIGGAYAFVVYLSLWTGTQPFYSDFYRGQPLGGRLVGFLAWMVCAQTLLELVRARRRPPTLVGAETA
jgi:Glycosyltransferase family 87